MLWWKKRDLPNRVITVEQSLSNRSSEKEHGAEQPMVPTRGERKQRRNDTASHSPRFPLLSHR